MIDRRQSRVLAMQALCLFESMGDEFAAQVDEFLTDEKPDRQTLDYARKLVRDVQANKPEIDGTIQASLENWELKRLAITDRNVLRVAVCEFLHRPDVPPKVAVNEAIEIGKEFGTKETGSFINGILDAIVKKREAATTAGGE